MKFIVFLTGVVLMTAVLLSACTKDKDLNFTCSDGIMNGLEAGVDCGGSCPPCPTCIDGVQNGIEQGVDCGGDCPPCATCSDGIQNGNETGIDCGPDCLPCRMDLLVGDWEAIEFSINNLEYFEHSNNQILVLSFFSDGSYKNFIGDHNFQGQTSEGSFEATQTSQSNNLFITESSGISSFVSSFSSDNNILYLEGFLSNGWPVTGVLHRILEDKCANNNCGGECNFGYCSCPNGNFGNACQVALGPAGGFVIYDKGSYSSGWRYIEATRHIFPSSSAACSTFTKWNYTLNGIGKGKENTVEMFFNCLGSESYAARTCLEYEQYGYDDWFLPSIGELSLISNFKEIYGCDESGTVLLSSSFYTPTRAHFYGFNCYSNFNSDVFGTYNDHNEVYGFIAIRYY